MINSSFVILVLRKSPKLQSLYSCLMEAGQNGATRGQLVEKVYGKTYREGKYPRYWESLDLNINQLISRLRKILRSLAESSLDYDSEKRKWLLNPMNDAPIREPKPNSNS